MRPQGRYGAFGERRRDTIGFDQETIFTTKRERLKDDDGLVNVESSNYMIGRPNNVPTDNILTIATYWDFMKRPS